MNNKHVHAVAFLLIVLVCPAVEAQAGYSKPVKANKQPTHRAAINAPFQRRPLANFGRYGYMPVAHQNPNVNLNRYQSTNYRYYLPPTATSCVDLSTAVYYPPDPPPPSYNPPGYGGTVDDGDDDNGPPHKLRGEGE